MSRRLMCPPGAPGAPGRATTSRGKIASLVLALVALGAMNHVAPAQALPNCVAYHGRSISWTSAGEAVFCDYRWPSSSLVLELTDPDGWAGYWWLAAGAWDNATNASLAVYSSSNPPSGWVNMLASSGSFGRTDIGGITYFDLVLPVTWSILNKDATSCPETGGVPVNDSLRLMFAVHELGHALGLADIVSSSSIMNVSGRCECAANSSLCGPSAGAVQGVNLFLAQSGSAALLPEDAPFFRREFWLQASSRDYGSLEALATEADLIVRGVVTGERPARSLDVRVEGAKARELARRYPLLVTDAEIWVSEVLAGRGAAPGEPILVQQIGGQTQDMAVHAMDVSHLTPGQEVVLFLRRFVDAAGKPTPYYFILGLSEGQLEVRDGRVVAVRPALEGPAPVTKKENAVLALQEVRRLVQKAFRGPGGS